MWAWIRIEGEPTERVDEAQVLRVEEDKGNSAQGQHGREHEEGKLARAYQRFQGAHVKAHGQTRENHKDHVFACDANRRSLKCSCSLAALQHAPRA